MKCVVFLFIFLNSHLSAFETSSRGKIAFESRFFRNDHRAETVDQNLGLMSALTIEAKEKLFFSKVAVNARVDKYDRDRQMLILEDAYAGLYVTEKEEWSFSLGKKVFNWGTLETFHPIDQVNARILDGTIESLEKKGEHFLEGNWSHELFSLSLYYWPDSAKPFFPSARSRLGFGARPTKTRFIDRSGGSAQHNWGGLLKAQIDSTDLQLSFRRAYDRSLFLVGNRLPETDFLQINFYQADHYGLSQVTAFHNWLLKTEVLYKDYGQRSSLLSVRGSGPFPLQERYLPNHWQVATGIEYGSTNQWQHDWSFFSEQQFFFYDNAPQSWREELSPFSRDYSLVFRYALNNQQGHEGRLGWLGDFARLKEGVLFAEYLQKIGDEWQVKIGLRYFSTQKTTSRILPLGLSNFYQDQHIAAELAHFF
jgi:hypothetical protein